MQFTFLRIKYYDGGAENSSVVLKLKPCQNKNDQKFVSAASKMVHQLLQKWYAFLSYQL